MALPDDLKILLSQFPNSRPAVPADTRPAGNVFVSANTALGEVAICFDEHSPVGTLYFTEEQITHLIGVLTKNRQLLRDAAGPAFAVGERVRLMSHDSRYNRSHIEQIPLGTVLVVQESIEGNPHDAVEIRFENGFGAVSAKCLERVK